MPFAVFQLFSNDLSLRYKNITVEPYGVITVDEGVPEAVSTRGRRVTWWNDISDVATCNDQHNIPFSTVLNWTTAKVTG